MKFQFGSRRLFVVLAIIAVILSCGLRLRQNASEKHAAIVAIQNAGGRVELASFGPNWLDQTGAYWLRHYVIGLTFEAAELVESESGEPELTLPSNVIANLDKFPHLQWLDFAFV
jgi:hypothetical protein